ncbi:unnamed protein product [Ixodes persulcatus]
MSAAILFTGASPTSVLRVFGARTFFNYQRGYLLPAINRVRWNIV